MIKNFIYTGVGSREVPNEVSSLFKEIGQFLAKSGFTLRSGHAPGSDKAFELGCNLANGKSEIYLPWYRFEGSNSKLFNVGNDAYEMAAKYHWNFHNASMGAKKLLARDCYQALGYGLSKPSDFIVCYTQGGKTVGGTAMVIKIAKDYGIPTFNYGFHGMHEKLQGFLMENYGIKLP